MAGNEQKGFERVTGLNTVKTLTVPSGTSSGWVQAEDQNVRVTFDGTDPTATLGSIIRADDPPIEIGVDYLRTAEFIEEVASAALSVSYFGPA